MSKPLPNTLTQLAGELLLKSPEFARLWERYDVKSRSHGRKTFHHPEVGDLTLGYQSMQLEGTPDHRLTTYYAAPGTAERDALISAKIDVDAYLSLPALDGALINLGAPSEPLPVNVPSLFANRRSYAGSLFGGIRETQEMLDFCARHGIGADIEVIPAEKINEAFERLLASDVRYRFVVDTTSLA